MCTDGTVGPLWNLIYMTISSYICFVISFPMVLFLNFSSYLVAALLPFWVLLGREKNISL